MAKDFEFLLYSCLPLLSHRSSASIDLFWPSCPTCYINTPIPLINMV
ncbi:hypothetical protein HZS_3822 [Henneguya salminicola]|nr:hypothetical protein HZS_3822 [Henneguya salminicola]